MAVAKKGTWWRTSKLSPSAETLRGLAPAGTRWVFVGENTGSPRIYTVQTADFNSLSPTYTARTPNGTDPLWDVAYLSAEGIINAVGDNGRVERSSDLGDSWLSLTLSGSPDLKGMVGVTGEALSRFVAVGVNAIFGQANTGVWTSRWSGSQQWNSVAHNATVGWVAVGNNGYVTQSTTGANGSWLTKYQVGTEPLWEIDANANCFIAVGNDAKVYRSTTGLSGSWTQIAFPGRSNLRTVAHLGSNRWGIVAFDGWNWTSDDDGLSWQTSTYIIDDDPKGIAAETDRAAVVGSSGGIYISFDQTQEDYVAPDIETPSAPPAFTENDDMAGDAVRRLSTQFRSGRG
jgi:hypothetical protein